MAKESKALHKLWKRRLTNWELSQQSGIAWCRANGIPYPTFSYWKKKLEKSQESIEPITADSFIEIEETATNQSPGIEIEIQGAIIRIRKDFDLEALHRCCHVLRRQDAISAR